MAVPVYYAMLGVSPGATSEQIERAFHGGIARCEPEARGGDRLAAQRYRALLEAYAVLGDPVRRAAYDVSLRHAGVASQAADAASGQPAVKARTNATGAEAAESQASGRTQRLWRRMRRPIVWSTALAVVIGAAFTGIVGSLVKDIITPFIGLATGGVDFSNLFIILKGTPAATLAEAQKAGDVTINYGIFLNAVINFLIVAFAIFWMVRLISKLYKTPAPAPAAPAPSPTETLLGEIRDLLKSK